MTPLRRSLTCQSPNPLIQPHLAPGLGFQIQSTSFLIVPSSLRRQCLTLRSSSAPLVKPHPIFMLRFLIRTTSFLIWALID
uniref:Uncharacterized protein n=1 Tax=Cannabis sativa TaxID=3483 RepID=A0A803QZG7_CANSA